MHQAFEAGFIQNLLAPTPSNKSKRFAVYRNNVFVSLVDALKARFPAVQTAFGREFFIALARDYASTHLPRSPLMMYYGEYLADFIESLPALADYAWIADLARVECAITQSHHAADARPLGPAAFANIAPEELEHLKFDIHPAMRIVESRHPIATLWQMNSGLTAVAAIDELPAETALIHRPYLSVSVKKLSPAGGVFLTSLKDRCMLGEAAGMAAALDLTFDLTAHLHLLIADGLITSFAPNLTPRDP